MIPSSGQTLVIARMIQMMDGVVLVAVPFYRPERSIEDGGIFAFRGYDLVLEVNELQILVCFDVPESIETSLILVKEQDTGLVHKTRLPASTTR